MFFKHKLSSDPSPLLNASCIYHKLFPTKSNLSSFDCRLIKCFNPKCTVMDLNGITTHRMFHFCCYWNMLCKNENDSSFTHIKVNSSSVSKYFPEESIDRPTVDTAILTHNHIILPVCCKRCYNTVTFAANNNGKITKKAKKNNEFQSN